MDPKRLLEGDDGAFETQLVRAARRDAAPDGAAQRAAVALGIGAASATLSSGAGAAGMGAASNAAVKTGFGLVGIGKWFGFGILAGVVTTGGFHYAAWPSSSAHDDCSMATASVRPPRPSPPASAPVALPASPEPAQGDTIGDETETPPRAERERAVRAPPRRPAAPKARARDERGASAEAPAPAEAETRLTSLAAELALLQEARRALVAHNPSRVLAQLQKYTSTPRSGLLDSEADVLRVEALVQAGRQPEAASLAASALRAAPEGPHAVRFRRILGADTPAP